MELPQAVPAVKPKWLALGAVAVLLVLVLRVSWVSEDAYITLRTVNNWIHGHGLRWNVDERVQCYPHPLWMLLLSAGYFITREAFVTTIFLGLFTTAAAALVLVHFARTAGHAVVAIVLLSLSRSFIDFSTSGLENPLSHLLLVGFIGLYAVRSAPLWKLALLAGLLACNRMEALWVVAPALAHASWLEARAVGLGRMARGLALGLSPWIGWELFSVFYYGFPFANTAYAQLNAGLPRVELIRQGVVYWVSALAWDLPLHVVALGGVVSACMARHRRDLLIALGLVLYTLYVIRSGGDFMQGRFWTVPFFTGACLLAISELPLADARRASAVVLPFAFLLLHPLAKESFARDAAHNGIADERGSYRDGMSLVLVTRTHPVPNHPLATLGRDLRGKSERVAVHESVGMVGYFAGPTVHVIDSLGLTDPLLARLPMRSDTHWRARRYPRRVPFGYVETVSGGDGRCLMTDKGLCQYYQLLHEVTAGPLFSLRRLKTLLALNLGLHDSLIDRTRYRDPKVPRASVEELSIPVSELAGWDSPGTLQVPATGMIIDLPARSHAVRLEISFDGNDGYQLVFRRAKKTIAALTSPAFERGAMRTRRIDVPERARQEGFDQLLVRPVGGDGMYSIGYVRLYDR